MAETPKILYFALNQNEISDTTFERLLTIRILCFFSHQNDLNQWPFLYHRRIILLDELRQQNLSVSFSSSVKFSSIKTGNRRFIRLNT